jgi:hypothetical protein
MKTKHIALAIVALLMLSSPMMAATVKAPTWPNLPATQVQLTVVNGTTSYFISTLSGVPAGFAVHNGDYPGWCVDRSVVMIRSVSHNVMLYSSLSLPFPVNNNTVIAINYILNHKQGNMMDIQDAIWHFTDNYTPPGGFSAAAQAMIDAADANPNYDPMTGAVLAVVCLPQNDRGAQTSIIELGIPGLGLSPGYWKHNVNVYNGGHGSYSGDPHITPAQLETYAAYIAANFHPGFTLAEAQQLFQDNQQKAQWLTIANWFNAAAGLLPYVED